MKLSARHTFIRTVLGDILPDRAGVCYAHEHLIIDASFTTHQSPDFQIDDVRRCTLELTDCKQLGVSTMIDSMPMACGRNVSKLAEASRQSGVNIVCPTGLHLQKYYPPGHWCSRVDVDYLAELFIREIRQGIDLNDGNGPEWEASPHRAGLIKIASSLDQLTHHEELVFRAAAIAHRKTGAPILTHCEQGTAAMQQIDLLAKLGANLDHVVLSHTDRVRDIEYHKQILSTGVRVEYDSHFRWPADQVNPTIELLVHLLPLFPNQIMVGMDAARKSYWKHYGGSPGMTYIVDTLVPTLKSRGVSEALTSNMLVTTPASAYSFAYFEGAHP
jgi:5-phospho-D-xylono-1,4-lactonase